MESFYLYLPSNDDSHSENTQSDFRVSLPTLKKLDGKWEVALTEIIYPHTWNNVYRDLEPENNIYTNAIFLYRQKGPQIVQIWPGHYDNVAQLVKEINTKTGRYKIKFIYYDILKRVGCTFETGAEIKEIKMSRKLAYMLGFDSPVIQQSTTAKYPADLEHNFHSLFVYSNIVEPTMVGSKIVKLLRICPVQGKYGDIVVKTFSDPHYVPLALSLLHDITISVKDNIGNNIRFGYGNVTVKLHFRKRKPPY